MREILFRGKRTDNGEWVEGHFYTQAYHPETIEEEWYWFIKPIGGRSWEYFRVDPKTVDQYTGLTDKNGKKIFEGDCLNHPHNVVEYLDGGFCVAGDRPLALMAKHSEVIGSIHDNPELLEVE